MGFGKLPAASSCGVSRRQAHLERAFTLVSLPHALPYVSNLHPDGDFILCNTPVNTFIIHQ
jgi:hypothetical protein